MAEIPYRGFFFGSNIFSKERRSMAKGIIIYGKAG